MIRPRALTALALVGAAAIPSSCGSDEDASSGGGGKATAGPSQDDSPLRVEASDGPRGTELIVYVIDEAANSPGVAAGRKKVKLRCFDKARGVVVEKAHPWPFTDTDNGLTDPHVHQRVAREKGGEVSRCELEGTRGPLGGELSDSAFE